MKQRILCVGLMLLIGSANVFSQAFLNRLGNAAVNAAENAVQRNVERRVEKAVDQAVDEAIDDAAKKKEEQKQQEQARKQEEAKLQEQQKQQEQQKSTASQPASNSSATTAQTQSVEQSGELLDPFACITQGAVFNYRTVDAKNKETGTSKTVVNSVSGGNGNYEISQTITLYDADGKLISEPQTCKATISNGNASVALAGGMSVDVKGNVPIIPSNLRVGLEMPTGDMVVTLEGMQVTQKITSNKCIAAETITTPAGSFQCFVVERQYTIEFGFVKTAGADKIWYSRNVGNVKTETYDKKGNLATTQLLVGFKK